MCPPATTPSQPMTSFSGRQWLLLVVLAGCNFLSAIIWSMQAPFYPAEAEKKGVTPTEYGFVFGIYELVNFIVSPLVSTIFQKAQPATAFRIGYLTVGTSTLAFGFLDRLNGRTVFLVLSIALRMLEAFGAAIVFISNYAFVTIAFPSSISTVFAVMESLFALGMASGPAVGGFLYQLGGEEFGFTLPFLVMGLLMWVSNLCAYPILPKTECESRESRNEGNSGFFTLLRIPVVLVYAFSIVSASMCSGFLTSTLEPHLRQFSLTPFMVGLVFLIYAGVYAATAALWGTVSDRISQPEYVTLTGSVAILVSFTSIGPASFIPISSSLALTGVSLAVFGLGLGAVYVSTFLLLLKEAWLNGFPKNPATSASATAIWMSSMSLGSFIGPSLGGVLLDEYGFRAGTLSMIGLFLILNLTLITSIAVRRQRATIRSQAGSETAPLLPSNPYQ